MQAGDECGLDASVWEGGGYCAASETSDTLICTPCGLNDAECCPGSACEENHMCIPALPLYGGQGGNMCAPCSKVKVGTYCCDGTQHMST